MGNRIESISKIYRCEWENKYRSELMEQQVSVNVGEIITSCP